jgi:serine/threonine-protein kinase ATR
MLVHLEEEDVEVLVETTFFIITHYWHRFNEDTQRQARELVEFLLEKRKHIMEAVVSKLPSFSHINSLADVEAKLSKLRKPVDSRTAFSLLAERISHENSGVVLQGLRELTSYLHRQQGYLQASAVSEQPDTVVTGLARALLDCSSKYATGPSEISQLCTQSIGLLGCLDFNRVETVRPERHIIVLSNFEDALETTDFVLYLMEEVLVKSFLSATDIKFQGFLSYAMQELLDRCDIGAAINLAGTRNGRDGDRVFRKYLALSEGTREVIDPFLSSKYKLDVPVARQQTEYPVFRPGRAYSIWLRNLTLDLLRRPQCGFAHLIFEPLCRVFRLKDLSAAEFLFPYLVLHVITGDESTDDVRANVLRELLTVLQYELLEDVSFAEKEDKKLYYEVISRRPLFSNPLSHVFRLCSAF